MEDIQEIKNLCISSNAFSLNGNLIKSDEKKQEAQRLIYIEGYNAAEYNNDGSDGSCIPHIIEHFTFLIKDWNNGVQEGFNALEISRCNSCQDSSIAMCYIHD
jgi:hypothetical protein